MLLIIGTLLLIFYISSQKNRKPTKLEREAFILMQSHSQMSSANGARIAQEHAAALRMECERNQFISEKRGNHGPIRTS